MLSKLDQKYRVWCELVLFWDFGPRRIAATISVQKPQRDLKHPKGVGKGVEWDLILNPRVFNLMYNGHLG